MTTTRKISELTLLTPSANLSRTFIPVYDEETLMTRKITLQQVNDAVEASIPIAESALSQAIVATTNAATADQKGVSAGNYANSAFAKSNTSLNVQSGGSITGDLTITGNITVTGCTATLSVSTLRTTDHVIDLGYNTVGTPTQNAGVRILRGDELPVQIRWNESSDIWQFTNDGTNYFNLSSVDNNFITASFNQANTANILAQASFDAANSALTSTVDSFSRETANAAFNLANNSITSAAYSNAAYAHANTGNILAQAAFDAANNFVDSWVRDAANSASSYANSGYTQANSASSVAATADQRSVTSGSYANASFVAANTADQKAVSAGDYANSAYGQANSATTNAATADQRAVTSGSYANSAFDQANTANNNSTTTGNYANSAYGQANTATTNAATADQRAVTSGSYANAAFDVANSASSGVIVADQRAVTSGSYANSAYTLSNVADQRAVTSGAYANAAFDQANTIIIFDQDLNTSNDVIFNRITTRTGEVYVNIGNTFLVTTTADGSSERTLSFDAYGILETYYRIAGNQNNGLLLSGQNGEAYTSIYLPKDSSANTEAIVIQNTDETGNITLSANASNWTFNHNGNLIFPNSAEIRDVGGDLRLRAAPGEVTQLQGIDSSGFVDSAIKAFYNSGGYVTINTNIDASEHIWTFDPNGDLTVPNYINFAGTTYIGDEPGAGTPTFRIVAPLNYGVTIETDSDISGNNCVWTFGENADLTFPDSTIQTTAFTTSPTLDVLKINDGVHEQYQMKGDATGTVEHDCSSGHIFYHISPDANWTANFTNLNLDNAYVTAVTLIITQGGTGYYPNAVQIGGVPQTINWQNNTTPTPSTNRTDVVTFSILNTGTGYLVLGQLTGF